MRSNAATSSHATYDDDVDYNDIHSLRAYVVRAQQLHSHESITEQYEDNTAEQIEENPEDVDWNPDLEL